MDRKFLNIMKDFLRHPFIMNEHSKKIIKDSGGMGHYSKIELDLSSARSDVHTHVEGDCLTVEDCPDGLTVKVGNIKSPEVDLKKIDEINGPFEDLFFNNDAGSGTAKLLVGNKGMFRAKKKNEIISSNEVIIYKDGTTTRMIDGANGNLLLSNSDSVTVLQNALDNYYNIYIKAGTYVIDTQLDIDTLDNQTILGAGIGKTILYCDDSAQVNIVKIDNQDDIVFRDITFNGNYDGNADKGDTAYQNCIYSLNGSKRTTILHCEILKPYAHGILFDGVEQGLVNDCWIHDTIASGVDFYNSSHGCIAEGNHLYDCTHAGLYGHADSEGIIFNGNHLSEMDKPIWVYDNVTACITNNTIRGFDTAGIYIAQTGNACYYCVINGNIIYFEPSTANTSRGIRLQEAIRSVVIGNSIINDGTGTNRRGVLLEAGSIYNLINNNTIIDVDDGIQADLNADNNLFHANNFYNSGTADITDAGAGNIASDNITS